MSVTHSSSSKSKSGEMDMDDTHDLNEKNEATVDKECRVSELIRKMFTCTKKYPYHSDEGKRVELHPIIKELYGPEGPGDIPIHKMYLVNVGKTKEMNTMAIDKQGLGDIQLGKNDILVSHENQSQNSASKTNIVMAHGFGAGLAFFFKNYKALSDIPNARIYAFDWLGMGRSSRPTVPFKHGYTSDKTTEECIDFFVESMEEWRRQHKLDKFVLMCHSMGGYLGAHYAMRHPSHVEKLIMVSPVGIPLPPSEEELEEMTSRLPVNQTLVTVVKKLWEYNFTPQWLIRSTGPLGRRMVENYGQRRFADLPNEDREALTKYIYHISSAIGSGEYSFSALLSPGAWARKPLMHSLPSLAVPTVFIYGQHDWMPIDAARELSQRMTKTRTIVHQIPNAGHHLYLDNPDEFNRVVIAEILKQ